MGQPADDAAISVGSIQSNTIEYNTDLFDDATIERMIGHFQTLLTGIVADAARPISQLPILTEAERRQLLIDWNKTAADYAKDKCFHELFEAQVERTPDSIAAVFEDRQLTYRELNARANRLAHYLKTLGVGPDVLVGVFVERSLEMIVALLGVMKAGGAYVPLDPTYPQDRLAFMLEDAGLALLVTQLQLLDLLPRHKARVVCLDADQTEFAQERADNPTHSSDPANLAYVIYTSGSTGKPKGVQIPHRALVNFVESMRRRPGISDKDVLLAVTTLSFDIAGLELYLPLTVGARVVIVGREILTDGRELAKTIGSSGATIMQATPATWRLLVESGWEGEKRLKILCGGEGWPPELADALLSRCGSLWNMYGPTETTIWSAVHPVESADRAIPVGRPIANTHIYIVDRYGQLAPIGVAGELLIGGDGLARGYLGRPELTAEKFIPDPFSGEPEARLYRTGDLARYLSNGNIELLGRIDHQVKVRGYRIELGEIETVLAEHPAVREAVVIVREDVPGDKRLVGYIVSTHDPNPTTTELRTFLQQKLPEYMVPGAFVFMDALPLTPNRKVDRRALPAPDTTRPELESAFVEPESGVEKVVAGIWAAALGLQRVGIHDNFFDLGGHSLLLAKVHGQLQAALRRDVPMIELFRYPTISTLAKYLSDAPEQRLSTETADRAERQRSAMYNRRRAQAAVERRGHQE
jgi:amino acid adenylation domain-containing protein